MKHKLKTPKNLGKESTTKNKTSKYSDPQIMTENCFFCPICKSYEYEYDGLLNRVCKNCGHHDIGGFT